MEKGYIFDIKKFALFDGPGIRQTVFFKGCPLSCSWCHNPEGKYIYPELMVSQASCIHCNKCIDICPSPENCILCGKCIDVCPLNLRRICGELIDSDTLVSRLSEDADFYETNGGGVTFSGGEPLMQPHFLIEVLKKCKLHKTIETSGFANEAVYREVYEQIDFIIQDFKIFDEANHIRYVGASNRIILKNIEFLCRGDKPFIIRIPLIPGVTDTEENFINIANLLVGAKALVRVELLRYIDIAGAKYSMINRIYEPQFNPTKEIYINQNIFKQKGIRSIILK